MTFLAFENVTYRYDNAAAPIGPLNFRIEPGETVCMLGTSGCGKTTALRLASGLLTPDAGAITIGDRCVADATHWLPPEERRIGLVFQNQSLFPHLTVAQNIRFGITHHTASEQAPIIEELLAAIQMEAYAHSYPATLSGGQQQRVAIARALAPKPDVMLMDEPFASLDAFTRRRVREEALAILKKTHVATLIVTHDPDEALEVADRLIILDQGQVIQDGSPEEVFFHPVSEMAAGLFGEYNALDVVAKGENLETMLGTIPNYLALPHGQASRIWIRPEYITVQEGGVMGYVERIVFFGSHYMLTVRVGEKHFKLAAPQRLYNIGDAIPLGLIVAERAYKK